jgi:hypothetical protein
VLSKTVGRLVLRMADADTPPQSFGDFATTVAGYLTEVKKLAADRRESDEKRMKLILLLSLVYGERLAKTESNHARQKKELAMQE